MDSLSISPKPFKDHGITAYELYGQAWMTLSGDLQQC